MLMPPHSCMPLATADCVELSPGACPHWLLLPQCKQSNAAAFFNPQDTAKDRTLQPCCSEAMRKTFKVKQARPYQKLRACYNEVKTVQTAAMNDQTGRGIP